MDSCLRPAPAQAFRVSTILREFRLALLVALLPALTLLGCAMDASAAIGRWRSSERVVIQQPRPSGLYAGGHGYQHQRPREERVIELPEDGDYWHLSFIDSGNQESQALRAYMSQAPRLTSLASQVKYHHLPATDQHAKRYYSHDAKPVLTLQTSTGRTIYKGSGGNLPRNAEELADELESSILAYIADCGPDGCEPPSETTPGSRIPDVRKDKPGRGLDPNDVAVLVLVGVGVVALVVWLRQRQS